MIKLSVLVLVAVCVFSPGLYAQKTAGQGWVVSETRQRSPSEISLAVTGSRYDIPSSTSEALGSVGEAHEIREKSSAPFPVLMPKAIVYPQKAVRRGWEGQTVVAVEVLPDGSVGRTALAKTSGHEVLDLAAQEAVQSWKFETESEKDETVPQFVDIPVTFKLQGEH